MRTPPARTRGSPSESIIPRRAAAFFQATVKIPGHECIHRSTPRHPGKNQIARSLDGQRSKLARSQGHGASDPT